MLDRLCNFSFCYIRNEGFLHLRNKGSKAQQYCWAPFMKAALGLQIETLFFSRDCNLPVKIQPELNCNTKTCEEQNYLLVLAPKSVWVFLMLLKCKKTKNICNMFSIFLENWCVESKITLRICWPSCKTYFAKYF